MEHIVRQPIDARNSPMRGDRRTSYDGMNRILRTVTHTIGAHVYFTYVNGRGVLRKSMCTIETWSAEPEPAVGGAEPELVVWELGPILSYWLHDGEIYLPYVD